jgi:hypothetical protein
MNLKKILAIALVIIFGVSCYFNKYEANHGSRHRNTQKQDEYIATEYPFDERVEPLNLRGFSQLNEKEQEYYRNNTWDPSKSLEQNRRILTSSFLKACVDRVEYVVPSKSGITLKLASNSSAYVLDAVNAEFITEYELNRIIYLLSDSPRFCRLLRSLLTKYKTMQYTPHKAVFLRTKNDANHTAYSILHHVLNLRDLDQTFLSSIDCMPHKMQLGATIFHEMLHWYHQLSNSAESTRRGKSISCICRHLASRQQLNNYRYNDVAIAKIFSNDEEYYTMYGLVEDEYGNICIDTLCEAIYSYEQYGYVRGSHVVFHSRSDERNFIIVSRDARLLKFFQNNASPKFGEGDFITTEQPTK